MCKSGWQISGHNARDQKCQSEETEAVQNENWPQGLRPPQVENSRRDISLGDDPPGDETEGGAYEKVQLRQHGGAPLIRVRMIDCECELRRAALEATWAAQR